MNLIKEYKDDIFYIRKDYSLCEIYLLFCRTIKIFWWESPIDQKSSNKKLIISKLSLSTYKHERLRS